MMDDLMIHEQLTCNKRMLRTSFGLNFGMVLFFIENFSGAPSGFVTDIVVRPYKFAKW